MPEPRRGIAALIEDRLSALARRAHGAPRVALVMALVLTAVALLGARRLRLDPDLVSLLPETFDSVTDLRALEKRAGAIGYVVVVLQGAPSETLRAVAEDIAPKIEALDSIRYVDVKRPIDWFEDRALFFLDLEDLETIRKRLDTRAQYEKRKNNPMYLDLEEGAAPPSVAFDDLEAKYTSRGDQSWLTRQGESAYYEDIHRQMLVVLARPAKRSTDMDFAKQVTGDVRAVLDTADLSQRHPGLTAQITGRYQKKIDQKAQISSDLAVASSLALGLSLLYLLIHFRRPTSVFLVSTPLVVGLLWTFGIAGVAFGTLNLLTGFIGAILLGLGIDHGIHLLSRFEAERADGADALHALDQTFGQTGRAVVIAALTTTVAFAGVAFSEFRAFREFGIIAAIGMVTIVISYSVVLPAMLGLGLESRAKGTQKAADASTALKLAKAPQRAFVFALLLGGAMASQLPRLSFDYDFAALEDGQLPAFRLDRETNRILGYSQTPVLVLTEAEAEERTAAAALRAQLKSAGKASTIDMVATLADVVPPQQVEKKIVIDRIAKIVRKVKPKWLDEDLRDGRKRLLRMAKSAPYDRAGLPDLVLRQFQGPEASPGEGFVLVFPRIKLSDGEKVPAFAKEIRDAAQTDARRLPVAGEAMILADILEMVASESGPVLGITLGLVLLTLWLLLGHLGSALASMTAAGATLAITLALAGLIGLRLNYLNIVMIPVLFGIAVDGAVHLLTRLQRSDVPAEVLTETGRAIAGALLTTGLGFGALLWADHPGLQSLGGLAVLGLGVNALVCLIGVPAGLLTFRNRSVEP